MSSGRWETVLRSYDRGADSDENDRVKELFKATTDAGNGDSSLIEETAAEWLTWATVAEARGASESARRYRHQAGRALALALQPTAAQELFDATAVRPQESPLEVAAWRQQQGGAWRRAGDTDRALEALQQALALQQQVAPDSVAVATTWVQLAELERWVDRRPALEQARRLFERLAPESVDLAHVLNSLGIITGDFEERLEDGIVLYQQALALRLRSIPRSYQVANTYSNIAQCARELGRLDDAEDLINKSLAIYPEADEAAHLRAGAFNSLALIQRDKGAYRAARKSWETSLEIYRQLDPEGPAVAGVSNNLGNLSLRVGDLERAQARYEESLEHRRRLNPESRAVAEDLGSEGVFGLSHAFLFAGARTLVTSLWPISDRATADWMEAFYRALEDGRPRGRGDPRSPESCRWGAASSLLLGRLSALG